MNKVIIDGCVQKEVKLYDEIASFNISSQTGKFTTVKNTEQNRYTYIRVTYPHEVDERIEAILQPGSMVRVYGGLDSEQYTTSSNKHVYNKIIRADKIVRIHYDKQIKDYVEDLI